MTVIMESERLFLRTWADADVDELVATNSPAVMRHLGPVPSREDQMAIVARQNALQAEHGHCFWVLERKADGRFLGFCGLKLVNAEGTDLTGKHEIGWRLREDAWRQGYAKEAAIASLGFGFAALGAPEVVALTVAQNEASWGLMRRLRMERAEALDFVDPKYGPELNPTVVYRIEAGAFDLITLS